LKPGDTAPDFAVDAALGGKEFKFSLAEALKKGPGSLLLSQIIHERLHGRSLIPGSRARSFGWATWNGKNASRICAYRRSARPRRECCGGMDTIDNFRARYGERAPICDAPGDYVQVRY
jgi:hypothetical protein